MSEMGSGPEPGTENSGFGWSEAEADLAEGKAEADPYPNPEAPVDEAEALELGEQLVRRTASLLMDHPQAGQLDADRLGGRQLAVDKDQYPALFATHNLSPYQRVAAEIGLTTEGERSVTLGAWRVNDDVGEIIHVEPDNALTAGTYEGGSEEYEPEVRYRQAVLAQDIMGLLEGSK